MTQPGDTPMDQPNSAPDPRTAADQHQPAETANEELVRLAAQIAAAPGDPEDEWGDARDLFVGLHELYETACTAGTHPAMIAHFALWMQGAAHDLAACTAGDLEDLCFQISCLSEFALGDADHLRDESQDDEWLPAPARFEQRNDASFDEFDAWAEMTSENALDAVVELVSQDAATAAESAHWGEFRDLFAAYHSGYQTPGLNPAVACHYMWRMSSLMGVMQRMASKHPSTAKLHNRAGSLLEDMLAAAKDAMYDGTDTSLEYALSAAA